MINKVRLYILLLNILSFILLDACDLAHFGNGPKSFYFDAITGNNHHKGTSSDKPWKSLEKLQSVHLNAGDHIYFHGDQEFKGPLLIKGINSTENNPLTILSYGNGKATLNAGDTTAILIEECNNVVIKNINVIGSGRKTGNKGNGVELSFVEHGAIDSVTASGFMWSGIHVTGGKDISISHVYAHDNGFSGIYVESGKEHKFHDPSEFKTVHNLYIGYCVAENNPGCPLVRDNHSGNGILIGGVTSGVIEYCEAMDNGWDMPRDGNGPVGIWAYMCDSIIIQQCYSHHNKTSTDGKDGGGFDLDGGVTNSIMQYNHSAWNEGAGYGLFQYAGAATWENNIVRYNTSLNDGSKNGHSGIYAWCDPAATPMKGCSISNNIIISDQGHGVNFEPGNYNGFNFENNIFALTGPGDEFIGGEFKDAKFENNQYWSFYLSTRHLPQPDAKYDSDAIYSEPMLDMPMMKN
jgi:hypothetical protein